MINTSILFNVYSDIQKQAFQSQCLNFLKSSSCYRYLIGTIKHSMVNLGQHFLGQRQCHLNYDIDVQVRCFKFGNPHRQDTGLFWKVCNIQVNALQSLTTILELGWTEYQLLTSVRTIHFPRTIGPSIWMKKYLELDES